MNTQTKEKTQAQNIAQDQPQQGKNAVAIAAPRLPYHPGFADRFGIDQTAWRALVEAIYPSAQTVEGVLLALSYCKARGLDPFKRPVHVVPIWSTALKKMVESVWPGINELRSTAFRTGMYAGCEPTAFGPTKKFHFDDMVGKDQYAKQVVLDIEGPEWAQITVYRLVNGVRCSFPGPKVFWLAAYGCQGKSEIPNDKWKEGGGSYMLEKCAEAAALRKAFPEETAGILTAEEMEGRKVDVAAGPTIDHDEPTPPRPTRESVKRESEAQRKDAVRQDREFRERMREDEAPRPSQQQVRENDDTIIHDTETGEVADDAAKEPQRETKGQAESAQQAAQTQQPAQKPAADHRKIADLLLDKIERTSRRTALEGMVNSHTDDLEAMRSEAPEIWEEVQAKLKAKREWFSKP